jgi:hypothetical protein
MGTDLRTGGTGGWAAADVPTRNTVVIVISIVRIFHLTTSFMIIVHVDGPHIVTGAGARCVRFPSTQRRHRSDRACAGAPVRGRALRRSGRVRMMVQVPELRRWILPNARIAIPLIAVLALPVTASAQTQFEGTVKYRMDIQGSQSVDMVHHVKGEDIRVDMNMSGQSISLIMNRPGTRQIFLLHDSQQWMDMKALQSMMAAMGRGSAEQQQEVDVGNLEIKATGQKETIAGHECEHYTFTSDGNQVDVCAATGLGWYFGTPAMGGGMMMGMGGRGRGMGMGGMAGGTGNQGVPGLSNAQVAEWQQKFANGFFPLKMTVTGENSLTLVVTELQQRDLDLPLFRAPATYTEMRIGGVIP